MSRFTVGSVPYVNAIPLVLALEEMGEESEVRVVYDVPSRLPRLLESGEADAILVSSVDALRTPDRRMAGGVCIGSNGKVKSVRLFSRVEPARIQSLALDASSMTSNRLAQVILRERYGATPTIEHFNPDLQAMLAECDACVLIGDIGMTAEGEGLYVLDLGEEWTELTGLPFVWAAWIGGEGLSSELARHLQESAATYTSESRRDRLIEFTTHRSGWPREMVADYFVRVMVYAMDERMLMGLKEFQRRLLRNGFEDCTHFPELVAGR